MYLPMLTHPASRALHSRAWFCRTREGLYINREGHVAAARKRSHRWWVSRAPNNTKTIGRMTCHCFLQPIRTDHTSSSHTTLYRVRSSMCCLLPGYSFENRPNSPVLGIATSAGKTSLAIKNNIDLSRSANVSNFKALNVIQTESRFFLLLTQKEKRRLCSQDVVNFIRSLFTQPILWGLVTGASLFLFSIYQISEQQF